MDLISLTAIIGSLTGSSVITTILQNRITRQKVQADQVKTQADSAGTLVDAILRWQGTLTGRIEALEKDMATKDMEIAALKTNLSEKEAEITVLRAKIEHLENHRDETNNLSN